MASSPGGPGSGGQRKTFAPDAWTSAWKPLLGGPSANPMGVDWFAMVFGLGFVLSFGYWCTNFLVVQRAMAAKNMTAARRTPLIAAVPKMLFPVLVILPGMLAVALASLPGKKATACRQAAGSQSTKLPRRHHAWCSRLIAEAAMQPRRRGQRR